MPRPISERRLGAPIQARELKPSGVPAKELMYIILGLDEAEAIRLADYEGLYQEAAARSMGVSRQTFGNIIEAARRKVADALLHGKAIRIEGGEVSIKNQEDSIKRIAVPCKEGQVDQHFGQAKEFLIYRVEGEGLVPEASVNSPGGRGCKSGIGSELARAGVSHLVAGNMGEGASRTLAANGIVAIRGATGDAFQAALAFARGQIVDSGISCSGLDENGKSCQHAFNPRIEKDRTTGLSPKTEAESPIYFLPQN
ncbi:MAG TPA: DUF134 domain-containing protein [Rectinemataceae bacterium]|nr:DUF134 domain-containing protein [Rectinemataceae bacterium]